MSHLPLRKSEVHFSSSLSLKSEVLLKGTAYDTSSNCKVAVVAVLYELATIDNQGTKEEYVRPAAFQDAAEDIVRY